MIDMKRTVMLLVLFMLGIGLSLIIAAQETPELTAEEILERTREAWQGESFHGTIRLEITLGGATKIHVLEIWTLGEDLALIRVLEPEEDAGSGYLEADGKLWYYAPLVGMAIELPVVALTDALFGSGPSLDDLSHGTLSDDYDVSVEILPDDETDESDAHWFLTLIPHADAPVVYGKLEIWVTADFVMEKLLYYDQRGAVLQTATFSEVIEIDGLLVPTMVVIESASGDRTLQQVIDPEFNLDLDPSFFTLETLIGGTDSP